MEQRPMIISPLFNNYLKNPKFIELKCFFEPRDIWVGLYWKKHKRAIEFYLCLLPCLPIHLYITDL